MSEDNLMQAIYETKRQNLLLHVIANGLGRLDPALVYAVENRIHPYFHMGDLPDYFSEQHFVKAPFMNEVITFVDQLWRDGTPVTFYSLEDRFGRHRIELIYIFEYAKLSGRFDEDFYINLCKNAPSEANSISSFIYDETKIYF